MPGIAKVRNVTLKKGIFVGDNNFWQWYSAIKMNTVKRATITIKLMDESGNSTMTWTLNNAFPTKVTGTDLKSEGNEVAIETIEIAHEGGGSKPKILRLILLLNQQVRPLPTNCCNCSPN